MAEQGKQPRIEAAIRSRVASGAYPAGDPMPSQAALMEEFEAARETVRGALRRLAAAGLIEMSQGRQAYVRQGAGTNHLASDSDAITWAERLGDGATDTLVSAQREQAEGLVAKRLQVAEGAAVVRRIRHQVRGETLMVVVTQWVSADVADAVRTATGQCLDDVDNPPRDDLFTLLHRAGLAPGETTEVSYARAATDAERSTFALPDGVPLLITSRVSVDQEGSPLEYSTMPSRADMVSLEATFPIRR